MRVSLRFPRTTAGSPSLLWLIVLLFQSPRKDDSAIAMLPNLLVLTHHHVDLSTLPCLCIPLSHFTHIIVNGLNGRRRVDRKICWRFGHDLLYVTPVHQWLGHLWGDATDQNWFGMYGFTRGRWPPAQIDRICSCQAHRGANSRAMLSGCWWLNERPCDLERLRYSLQDHIQGLLFVRKNRLKCDKTWQFEIWLFYRTTEIPRKLLTCTVAPMQ